MGRTETWGSLCSGEAPGAGAQAGFQQAAHAEAELGMVSRVTLQKSWEGCSGQREQQGQAQRHTRRQRAVQVSPEEGRLTGGGRVGRGTRQEGRGPCVLHWASSTPSAPGHSPALPLVLAAGIEANIPVTYGIGSQRGDKSTGCQFIGQSPVHSVSAAAHSPPPAASVGLGRRRGGPCRSAGRSLPAASSGLAPTPDNSSPTGTSGHFHMELLLQGVAATWRRLRSG